ncbi:hypothetical protein DUI87_15369 [Hirundo rustica rustica]|uniref:Uncharacterized protein n=1 Tax=Hirundo rustica rustica TaxID=333673 RepID=A0A3M0K484_HIRRU|nr:hypothetical protein DUI87_15369 [Hirundo rustica rustica]
MNVFLNDLLQFSRKIWAVGSNQGVKCFGLWYSEGLFWLQSDSMTYSNDQSGAAVGQQLGLCRAVTHRRSLLCSLLQAQFIPKNRRGSGAKKTSDNLKWIYLYEKTSVGYAEERTPKVIPHFSSNGFN